MSAFPLAAQDAAGALSLAARKAASIATSDADVSSDFDAALAQSAAALPTPANGATPATASTQAANPESWRERVDRADGPVVSSAAGNPAATAAQMTFPASVVPNGDRIEHVLAGFPAREAQASPSIAAPPGIEPPPPRPEILATKTGDARERSLADATRSSDAAPHSVGLASNQVVSDALTTRLKPSGEAKRGDASAGAAASHEEAQATASAPLPARVAPLETGLAQLIAAAPALNMEAAAPTASGDLDAVARIGAALAVSKTTRDAADASDKAAGRDASAAEGTSVAVHIVAQRTWLQPVSPVFSSGFDALGTSDHSASAPPRDAVSGLGAIAGLVADDGASAASSERAATPSVSQPEPPPQSAFGGVIESQTPAGVPLNAAPGAPAITRAANVASSGASAAPGAGPAPRRDLEIALAPKDLGGLAIHLKSVGDRLEIAFVADRGETARLISDGSAALATQLNDAGLGLGGVDISAASAQGGGTGEPHSDGAASGGAFGGRAGAESRQPSPEFTRRDRQERNHESGQQTSDSRASGDRGLFL